MLIENSARTPCVTNVTRLRMAHVNMGFHVHPRPQLHATLALLCKEWICIRDYFVYHGSGTLRFVPITKNCRDARDDCDARVTHAKWGSHLTRATCVRRRTIL